MDHSTTITLILGIVTILLTVLGVWMRIETRLTALETRLDAGIKVQLAEHDRRLGRLEDQMTNWGEVEHAMWKGAQQDASQPAD